MRFACCLLLLAASSAAQAQSINCASVPRAMPLLPSVLAPVASELVSASEELVTANGVLARAYDDSQSVDQVLLRMNIERCKNVAMVMPAPSVVDPNDPAAYKPKTEFDNTPWRFNMKQNGKNMTADEFSAWMKARGVRVARGAGAAPVAEPPAAGATAPGTPPGSLPAGAPAQPAQPPPPRP